MRLAPWLPGTSAGVGFAIPMAAVERVVSQLIQYGKIVRPALNVQVAALNPGACTGRHSPPARRRCVCVGSILRRLLRGAFGAHHSVSFRRSLSCKCSQSCEIITWEFFHMPQIATDRVARALKVSNGALIQALDGCTAGGKAGMLPTRR